MIISVQEEPGSVDGPVERRTPEILYTKGLAATHKRE
jgi:hypothetical protein